MAFLKLFFAALLLLAAPTGKALAQTPQDRADASIAVEQLRENDQPGRRSQPTVIENGDPAVELDRALMVGAVFVEGATLLPQSAFAPVIEPYIGRELSMTELRALASDVANLVRRKGYGLATAWIPQQRMENGILKVALDEGRVHDIRIEGRGATAVRPLLMKLATGEPVTTILLERQMLLAEDVAGVRVGRARLERRADGNVLTIATIRDRVEARAYLDNWGSSAVGPLRAELIVDFNGLLADDDRLTIGGMTTPAQPRELALVRLAYSKQIGANGAEVTVSTHHVATEPGGVLKGSGIKGRANYAEVAVGIPLVRGRSTSLWAYARVSLVDSEQRLKNLLIRDDRIAAASATLYGTTGGPNSRIRGRITFTRGLDLFGATGERDPLASRFDGSGSYSKLDGWAAYDAKLGAGFSINLQAIGQIASRPLLSVDEMGLGGRFFLRGYDFREFSGDAGIAGSAELRLDVAGMPRPLNALQFFVYGDAGTVSNYRNGFGSGTLASAGGGARFRIAEDFEAGLEVGVPLQKGFDPAASRNPRGSATISASF